MNNQYSVTPVYNQLGSYYPMGQASAPLASSSKWLIALAAVGLFAFMSSSASKSRDF